MDNQHLTANFFYAVGGGSILFLAYVIWRSFLLGWQPIIIDFNYFGEGFFELLIISWAAVYTIIYIDWTIRKYHEAKQ
jgi:hypothetical protein